jgi:hypothetical protein
VIHGNDITHSLCRASKTAMIPEAILYATNASPG